MRRNWKITALALPIVGAWLGCSVQNVPNPLPLEPANFPAPAKGAGFQFKTDSFEVPANTEEQDCYFFKVGDLAASGGLPKDQPVNLHRVQMVQKEGSHHMNLFRVRSIVGLDPAKGVVQRGQNGSGECFKSPNWADWPLIANTQQKGDVDWTFPDGVANVLRPDEWIMLQTHYVNASSQKSPDGRGSVTVNFYTMPKEEVKHELGTLFATKQSIRICSKNPRPTFEGGCQIKSQEPVTIIGANGHFHGRGKEFGIFTWDGTSTSTPPESQRIYQSKAWDDPPMLRSPELSAKVPANGGVYYTCSYQWQPPDPAVGCQGLNDYDQKPHPGAKDGTPAENLDCCYTFGPIVEKNEHCNVFVYYYPKQDNVACF